jgi:hypothetical protein
MSTELACPAVLIHEHVQDWIFAASPRYGQRQRHSVPNSVPLVALLGFVRPAVEPKARGGNGSDDEKELVVLSVSERQVKPLALGLVALKSNAIRAQQVRGLAPPSADPFRVESREFWASFDGFQDGVVSNRRDTPGVAAD